MDNDRLRNTSDHPRLLPGHITAAFNSKAFEDIFAGKMYKGGNLHNVGYEDEHLRACARYVTYTNKLFVSHFFDNNKQPSHFR